MGFGRRGSEHRELTKDAFVVSSRRGYAGWLIVAGAVLVAIVLLGAGVRYFMDALSPVSRIATMEQENVELREALEKARFDLEVELATRGELERQLATQSERLRQAEEELAFIKAASGRKPAR